MTSGVTTNSGAHEEKTGQEAEIVKCSQGI